MWQQLPRDMCSRQAPAKPPAGHFDKAARLQEPAFRDALRALLDEGAFSKGLKLILSDGICSGLDLRVQEKMASLHPAQPAPSPPEVESAWPWDNSDTGRKERLAALERVIHEFPVASAGGPSGLRPQHLSEALHGGACSANRLLSALDAFNHCCLDGWLLAHARPFLMCAWLVALHL